MYVFMARVLCLWSFCDPAMVAVSMTSVLSRKEIPTSLYLCTDAGTNCPDHGQGCNTILALQ